MTDRWKSLLVELDDIHHRILDPEQTPAGIAALGARAEELAELAGGEIVRAEAKLTVSRAQFLGP
jgi:hypothetical protein